MNGAEAREYAKRVFEKASSTQHDKLDALYQLNLQALDERIELRDQLTTSLLDIQDQIDHNPLFWVPKDHRGKAFAIFLVWAGLVSLAFLERLWTIAYSLGIIGIAPPF